MKMIRIALLSVAIPLSGCANNETKAKSSGSTLERGTDYLTAAQSTVEYFSEATSLSLAPNWEWPMHPIPAKMPNGDRMMYEVGFGKQAAGGYWFCSWAATAVAANHDHKGLQEALDRLLTVRNIYYYKHGLDARSKRLLNKELGDAIRGDLSRLRREVQLNCVY